MIGYIFQENTLGWLMRLILLSASAQGICRLNTHLCCFLERAKDQVISVVRFTSLLDFVGWPASPRWGDLLRAKVKGISEWFMMAIKQVTPSHEDLYQGLSRCASEHGKFLLTLSKAVEQDLE